MSIAKILAPLTGGARDMAVLSAAFVAAEPFAAHIAAIFVRPDPAEVMPFFGEGISGPVLQEIVDVAERASDHALADAKATLTKAAADARAEILDVPEKKDGVTVSLRETEGHFADEITRASALSDLVVFGPLIETDKPGLTEAFETVLLEAGRPVLLTARTPPSSFAKRIAIGCDSSIALAHALTASLPYLKQADSVELFTICRANEESQSCCDARDYLALHGISSTEREVDPGARAIGAAILDCAADCNADLLVLGGYAHSRLRQTLFGGVTRHVVSHAQVPLFLVH